MGAAEVAVEIPRLAVANVVIQFQRLILGENTHGINAGIDTVGEREVNDAVFAAERNGRFCGVFSQYIQSAALAAGQKHGDALFFSFDHSETPLIHLSSLELCVDLLAGFASSGFLPGCLGLFYLCAGQILAGLARPLWGLSFIIHGGEGRKRQLNGVLEPMHGLGLGFDWLEWRTSAAIFHIVTGEDRNIGTCLCRTDAVLLAGDWAEVADHNNLFALAVDSAEGNHALTGIITGNPLETVPVIVVLPESGV